ncbi:MAG TPA: FHA domain-containing protein [Pyrinomonadaceae bacterium]|nr:FHA domain-containing protein [Pyrinomonadaceae bacterium]
MLTILLTYPTPEGSQEIVIDSERTTFGRGSEATHRFSDDGLSRLHATVYRDGDRVWIVDENSSNGTFVNGVRTAPAGTPLRNGDSIRIGHRTELNVRISEMPAPEPTAYLQHQLPSHLAEQPAGISIVPVALIAFAITIVSLSAVFIGYTVLGSGKPQVAQDNFDNDDPYPDPPSKKPSSSPSPKTQEPTGTVIDLPEPPAKVPINIEPNIQDLLKNRKYLELNEAEKRKYVGERAMKIAQIIGNNSSEPIPPAALDKIKAFVDAYAKRANVKPLIGCRFGDNLQVTYERASRNAPFIIKAFNEKGTDPRIGLYLAMIESEHCVCLQSPTGPLGMFQFTKATGELHGLKTVRGASPSNPDERCEPEPSARAAASYMKALTGRYGTGPASVPLAIGSYNSGEGGLSSNLVKALESNAGLPRDFWTLIANGDKLSKQFQAENFKYVPKFFAAAIIGEYPQDFGLRLQPLSTYSG